MNREANRIPIENYWKEFYEIKTTHQIPAKNIWNMDEVAVVYDMLPTFVVEEKGRRNALIHYSGSDKRRCTVVLTCSAAGQRLPPTIIFRGKQVKHWSITQLTKERGTIIQVQPKAWMTSSIDH
eukprot:TRINITY_DN1708_c0_g1_i6.p1 TRINITY_DN1708_c0_g1~~TRINITY_DN1708_c0_g1_i6.p1  ORF type:complete len:124 (-),score=20.56 TRINITY_DN1708_c0_g1_i6:202-573(-)